MRHVISLAMFVAAFAVYVTAGGPTFMGIPLLSGALIAVGVMLEISAWWRITHPAS